MNNLIIAKQYASGLSAMDIGIENEVHERKIFLRLRSEDVAPRDDDKRYRDFLEYESKGVGNASEYVGSDTTLMREYWARTNRGDIHHGASSINSSVKPHKKGP
jgi:hypothetical protein